ncbi:MAG: PAS domain S-box protein [Calditrichota bacterium]
MKTTKPRNAITVGASSSQQELLDMAAADLNCNWEHCERLSVATSICHHREVDIVLFSDSISEPEEMQEKFIRACSDILNIPVMIYNHSDNDIKRLLEYGAQACLFNDIADTHVIKTLLDSTVERQETRRGLQQFATDMAEDNKRYLAIFTYASTPYVILDTEGRIQFVNHAAELLLGFSSDQLSSNQMRFGRGVANTAELATLDPVGQTRILELDFAEVELAGNPVYLTSLRDITGQKLAEEKMHMESSYRTLPDFSGALFLEPEEIPIPAQSSQKDETSVLE